MNNIVFIGVDTYGLPTDYQAEITAINNWPRIAQISWMLTDENGEVIKHKTHIISHKGNEIPMGAVSQQGITKETAERDGFPIAMVLSELIGDMAQVKRIVAHNIDYHRRIIEAEMIRLNMNTDILSQAEAICTMQASTAYCMLPPMNNGKYKYPDLSELHLKLFGYSIDKSCDIATQLVITKNCYIELVRRGVITPKVRTIIEHGNCGAEGDNVKYELTDDRELVIYGEGKMKDYDYLESIPFQCKENIKVVIIKEGVTKIGDFAFYGCSSLTSVTIPKSVTEIGNWAFSGCSALTSITIPESVTEIGKGAFWILYLEALNNQNYSEITKYKPLIINTF